MVYPQQSDNYNIEIFNQNFQELVQQNASMLQQIQTLQQQNASLQGHVGSLNNALQLRYIYDSEFLPWLKNNVENNVPLICLFSRLTDSPYQSETGIVVALYSRNFSQDGIYTFCAGPGGFEYKVFKFS